ncbi:MAG TPA: DNA polymerase III subunit beta, partial [Thermoanaerobaculia bacterium]|nr:DNA polymerase III subunit beta [Thermoanaerobaculia bacterium]
SEESRFQLNGALLKLRDSHLELVATDGHRLALVDKEIGGLSGDGEGGGREDSVLVPRKALQELQRFESDEPVGYRRGEHHLSFRLGHRELICRILEGTFPDYERVIAKDNDKKAVFDRRHLADAVKRVALLTGERARAVRLAFAPDEMVVSAVNPDLGEATERVGCEYDGPEFKLGINPDYLEDFLAAVDDEKVRLELKDENTQTVGYPASDSEGRYLCVIMPMRI